MSLKKGKNVKRLVGSEDLLAKAPSQEDSHIQVRETSRPSSGGKEGELGPAMK
jgi:hypothetical protein